MEDILVYFDVEELTWRGLQLDMPQQRNKHHPCHSFNKKVDGCHSIYGKLDEECVREELEQKQCYAQLLCAREAYSFYDEKTIPLQNEDENSPDHYRSLSKVSCSTFVESFAKPENYSILPEGITKEDQKFCRKVAHSLATCLGQQIRLR